MRVREVSAWLYKHGWRGRAEGPCRARVGGFGPLWVCSFEISGGVIRRAVLVEGGSRSDALPGAAPPGSAASGRETEGPG